MGLPYFQNWGTPHLPAIFGDFFFQNVNFDPKISKSSRFIFDLSLHKNKRPGIVYGFKT